MVLNYIRVLLVLFFSLLFINPILSQQKNRFKVFSDDSKIFFKELKTFMLVTANSENKETVFTFEKNYNKGKISEQKLDDIRDFLNIMLNKKKKPSIHFKQFLKSLNNFTELQYFNNELDNWLSILEYLVLESTNSRFIKFMGFSEMFFLNKTLITNKSLTWQLNGLEFKFVLDSIPLVYFPSEVDLNCFARDKNFIIKETKGFYNPISNIWYGNGGNVDWSRLGVSSWTIRY